MKIARTVCTGFVIGTANIIPGVSGGTLILILGIYERLINAINNISFATVSSVLGLFRFKSESFKRFKEEMEKIDALFLILICLGALCAIVVLAQFMTYLLMNWHDPTYGFFFGLVFVSIWAPYKLIKNKTGGVLLMGFIAFAMMFALSLSSGNILLKKAEHLQPVQTELIAADETLMQPITAEPDAKKEISVSRKIFFFVCGAVAISAMILPGISGSLVLLLMGGYFDILRAITERDWLTILVFGLGFAAGLLLFSKLLDFLLKKYYDKTMGFLVGLVVGSLYAIWPFKSSQIVGGEKVYMHSIIPNSFGVNEIMTIVTFLAGALVVILFFKLEKKYSK